MSDLSRRRSRRPRQIQVELLEGRALLSASSVSSTKRVLLITPSSEYANQQEGTFTVTLTLAKAQPYAKVEAAGGYTAAALDEPVTVDLSASLESTSAGFAPVASPFFAPFNESVTFPAGASSETVTVPIISTAATPGPVTIALSATTTVQGVSSDVPVNTAVDLLTANPNYVFLYSSPDAVPPTITSVQLVTQGKLASAVVLGFSKPMAPATVENIHNYRILSRAATSQHSSITLSGNYNSTTTQYQSFAIAAATYDPSTRAVTLTLKRPAKASSLYQISSGYPLRGHVLTDLQGQPFGTVPSEIGSAFSIGVRGSMAAVSWAPGPVKSNFGGTTGFLSGLI
jgi:hypothetical protein